MNWPSVDLRLDEWSEAVKYSQTANNYASDHQQRSAVGEQCYVSDNQLQSQQGDSDSLQPRLGCLLNHIDDIRY